MPTDLQHGGQSHIASSEITGIRSSVYLFLSFHLLAFETCLAQHTMDTSRIAFHLRRPHQQQVAAAMAGECLPQCLRAWPLKMAHIWLKLGNIFAVMFNSEPLTTRGKISAHSAVLLEQSLGTVTVRVEVSPLFFDVKRGVFAADVIRCSLQKKWNRWMFPVPLKPTPSHQSTQDGSKKCKDGDTNLKPDIPGYWRHH